MEDIDVVRFHHRSPYNGKSKQSTSGIICDRNKAFSDRIWENKYEMRRLSDICFLASGYLSRCCSFESKLIIDPSTEADSLMYIHLIKAPEADRYTCDWFCPGPIPHLEFVKELRVLS